MRSAVIDNKKQCLEAAAHWNALAAEYESAARWDHSRGLFVGAVELMPGFHKARMARAAAEALQLEAETGEAHCTCHLRPMRVIQHALLIRR